MLDKSQLSDPVPSANISEDEIARFDALAESWWDPNGKYKTALAFNAARVEHIVSAINKHFKPHGAADTLFNGLSILDVGSGGGLICEPLAMRGAEVTGIDASSVSVEVAKRHAQQRNLSVSYHHSLAGEWARKEEKYDVVINAEVVEHVPDQYALIQDCAAMVKPGGLLILATINRTLKSYLVAIVGAEYIMRYLPVGTHDWRKFVTPKEMDEWVGTAFVRKSQCGFALNPLNNQWRQTSSVSVNYLCCYKHSA